MKRIIKRIDQQLVDSALFLTINEARKAIIETNVIINRWYKINDPDDMTIELEIYDCVSFNGQDRVVRQVG